MAEEAVTSQGKEGLRGTARWSWEALKQAKTNDQCKSVLAQVFEKVGDGEGYTLTVHVTGPAYVRIMGNAWLAKQFGEIEEISPQAYFDRALQVMEINLKNVAVRRRQ